MRVQCFPICWVLARHAKLPTFLTYIRAIVNVHVLRHHSQLNSYHLKQVCCVRFCTLALEATSYRSHRQLYIVHTYIGGTVVHAMHECYAIVFMFVSVCVLTSSCDVSTYNENVWEVYFELSFTTSAKHICILNAKHNQKLDFCTQL